MNARRWIYALACAILVAVAIVSTRAMQRQRLQRVELARIRQQLERRQALALENGSLREQLNSPGHVEAIKGERTQLVSLRQNLDKVRMELRSLQRAAGEKADPVWPEGAVVLHAAQWQNVGAATPQTAMQSFLSAARDGDIDGVTRLIALQPLTKAEAASAFSQLPAATQAQYGTPEKMIATYVAAKFPDYDATAEVQPEQSYGNVAVAQYRMADAAGDQSNLTLLFEKSSDGNWQLAVPRAAVAEYLIDLRSRPGLK